VGLEVVEIVMDVEETFGISLPDARVSEIRTVGELQECIVEVLGRDLDEASLRQVVLEKLCGVLTVGERVAGETRLASLFPYAGRRRAWARLEQALGWSLPPLERPRAVTGLLVAVAAVLGWVAGLVAMFVFCPPDPPAWLAAPLGLGFAVVAIFLLWRLGRRLTIPLARCWPMGLETVGDLADFIIRHHYGRVVKREEGFSREGVWCILQEIVANVLRVDRERVTPESHFVEDLGAG
jgi:acyl carrier protein